MKKSQALAIVLTASLFMGFALGSSSAGTKKEITDTTAAANGESAAEETTTAAENSSTPTIEETVVYDEGGITITAKEYTTGSIFGDGIKFLIENNTSQNITVGATALIVNDYMIGDLFVAEAAAGKKTNETMELYTTELNEAGIDTIGQIEVYFHIFDSDTYEAIADTDCITIKTSMYDQMDVTVDNEGQVLYDQDGIKILGKYVDESDFWGTAVLLYIENNSDENVMIQTDNFSINGYTLDAYFSSTVYAGKKAYDSITVFSTDLEENDITSVDEVSLTFKFINPDTYSTISESDEITFAAK